MRLRSDDFVSYTIGLQGVCRRHARVCRCQIPACVSATPPHTLRTEPARCGLRPAKEGGLNCKQPLTQPTNYRLVLPHNFSDRVRLGAPLKEFLVCSDGRRAEAQPVSLRWGKPHPTFFDSKYSHPPYIAIHRKPHTVLRRLTGHSKKWRSHFLGKPALYQFR